MSEPAKKPVQQPESYQPKKPEIVGMVEQAQNDGVKLPERRTKVKLGNVRIIEIPPFRAVSSGQQTCDDLFGEGEGTFDRWMQKRSHLVKDLLYASPDFLWHEEGDVNKSVWIWAIKDDVMEADVAPYEIIEYEGGMFVVATADENDGKSLNKVVGGMVKWIEKSGVFERDERPGHRGMCHMVGCGTINRTLGIAQQEIFLPVKFISGKEA